MYYEECTKAYAVEFIKEIIENAQSEAQALEFIRDFLNGEITTTEIEDFIY